MLSVSTGATPNVEDSPHVGSSGVTAATTRQFQFVRPGSGVSRSNSKPSRSNGFPPRALSATSSRPSSSTSQSAKRNLEARVARAAGSRSWYNASSKRGSRRPHTSLGHQTDLKDTSDDEQTRPQSVLQLSSMVLSKAASHMRSGNRFHSNNSQGAETSEVDGVFALSGVDIEENASDDQEMDDREAISKERKETMKRFSKKWSVHEDFSVHQAQQNKYRSDAVLMEVALIEKLRTSLTAEARARIFDELFTSIIQKDVAWGPLLGRIKSEYDCVIGPSEPASLRQNYYTLQSQHRTALQTITRLQDDFGEVSEQLAACRAENSRLQQSLHDANRRLNDSKRREQAEMQLSDYDMSEIERLHAVIERLANHVDKLEVENADLRKGLGMSTDSQTDDVMAQTGLKSTSASMQGSSSSGNRTLDIDTNIALVNSAVATAQSMLSKSSSQSQLQRDEQVKANAAKTSGLFSQAASVLAKKQPESASTASSPQYSQPLSVHSSAHVQEVHLTSDKQGKTFPSTSSLSSKPAKDSKREFAAGAGAAGASALRSTCSDGTGQVHVSSPAISLGMPNAPDLNRMQGMSAAEKVDGAHYDVASDDDSQLEGLSARSGFDEPQYRLNNQEQTVGFGHLYRPPDVPELNVIAALPDGESSDEDENDSEQDESSNTCSSSADMHGQQAQALDVIVDGQRFSATSDDVIELAKGLKPIAL